MHKLIPITVWAERRYDPAPSAWVLRRWARDGQITPPAERVGREWYVAEDATRGAATEVTLRTTLLDRLREAATT